MLTFEATPMPFITEVVLPGLREIHARHTDDIGDPIGFVPDWNCYELTWKRIPLQVAKHANRYCPSTGAWPRCSHLAHWPMGSLPFQYPWSWDKLDSSNLTAAAWRPR
jgi:hypothetical protein